MDDIPSPIDLRNMVAAQEWAESAMRKRPWRRDFFRAIVSELSTLEPAPRSVLELGSGPGFLAATVLAGLPGLAYIALDSSPAMHTLARRRLGRLGSRVRFLEIDFKDPRWTDGLPAVDVVVTMQAVHELRHKRHARNLYAQARTLLRGNGVLLVCDHFLGAGGMSDGGLYMTPDEQEASLLAGGFAQIQRVRQEQGLVLFKAAGSVPP